MQTITVKQKDANTKIEKYLLSIYTNLSYGTLQKALRKRDIKVNGTRIDKDYIVKAGDVLDIYITDDLLSGSGSNSSGSNSTGLSGSGLSGSYPNSSGLSGSGSNSSDPSGSIYSPNAPENQPIASVNRPSSPKNCRGGFSKDGSHPSQTGFKVAYEDENLLVVNKAQGIPVHPDKDQLQDTLIDQVRLYLESKASSERKDPFQPSLCHRLDRNTGGLVIIAKNKASYDILLNKIEAREIMKYYKCLVKGRMEKNAAQLNAYLWKDARKSKVFVNSHKTKGALSIITAYKVLKYYPSSDVSMLEVELITGRTHQIRAHMAYIGHPILGDGKYGSNAVNRMFGLKMQALWAYKLCFNFKEKSLLDYLNGKELMVEPNFNIKSL